MPAMSLKEVWLERRRTGRRRCRTGERARPILPSCGASSGNGLPILQGALSVVSTHSRVEAEASGTFRGEGVHHWTTIVLSIVGTALVAAQVAIFWQQTRLFRQQAVAANVDRAEKLRGRIGTNLVHGRCCVDSKTRFASTNRRSASRLRRGLSARPSNDGVSAFRRAAAMV